MNAKTFVESLAVSIVSTSSSKVRLCWKEFKQEVSRDSRNFGKIWQLFTTPHSALFSQYPFKKRNFLFCNEEWLHQKTLPRPLGVKSAHRAEPILLTVTLLKRALLATPASGRISEHYSKL